MSSTEAVELMSGVTTTSDVEKLFMTYLVQIHHQEKLRKLVPPLFWDQNQCHKKHQHQQKTYRELRHQEQGQGPVTRLSIGTNNFEKRLGGGGCGSVFEGVLTSGTRVVVKRLEVGVTAGTGATG